MVGHPAHNLLSQHAKEFRVLTDVVGCGQIYVTAVTAAVIACRRPD